MNQEIKYKDLGLIFDPSGDGRCLRYSQVPTPFQVSETVIRVYLAGRNHNGETFIYYLDVCADDPRHVIKVSETPILGPSKLGAFDEHGTMPSCVLLENSTLKMYYSGWSLRKSVPYNNLTGCATSTDGRNFRRSSIGPVLGQSRFDPLSATSPWVLKHNNAYLMFYCAGLDWIEIDGKLEHTYNIKVAKSSNGLDWLPTGKVAIEQSNNEEAITRPTVLKTKYGYHMWFCSRQSKGFRGGPGSYKIGYAYSEDLKNWKRKVDPISPYNQNFEGWANNMQAYPAAISVNGNNYLFYNGNQFGSTGFGVMEISLEKTS